MRKYSGLAIIGFFAVLLVLAGLNDGPVSAQSGGTVSLLCHQYLRSQPTEQSERVGRMNPGEQHSALGRYGGWVYVQVDSGLAGWAYDGRCLQVNEGIDALPFLDPASVPRPSVQQGPPAILGVSCPQNLRSLPSLNGARIDVLQPADGIPTIIGRSADATWLYVQTADGKQGWTYAGACLRVQGDLTTLPLWESDGYVGPPVAYINCPQYLRAQPVATSAAVRILRPEDGPLPVMATTEEGTWIYLQLADGTSGWTANAACVTVLGRVWDAPFFADDIIPEETLTALPPDTAPFVRIACAQYLRAAPSLTATRLTIMRPSDARFLVTGRTADANWLYLTGETLTGWAARGRCLDVVGDVLTAPVIQPEATPTP
ncbi:MAG: hypothetical protein Kow0077_24870 [Anaerolineae bacterium]